jgi:hypothetical protein
VRLCEFTAVNGPAAGFGLALALASDIWFAARSAVFRVAFLNMGLSRRPDQRSYRRESRSSVLDCDRAGQCKRVRAGRALQAELRVGH